MWPLALVLCSGLAGLLLWRGFGALASRRAQQGRHVLAVGKRPMHGGQQATM
jgi:hypothetical protein